MVAKKKAEVEIIRRHRNKKLEAVHEELDLYVPNLKNNLDSMYLRVLEMSKAVRTLQELCKIEVTDRLNPRVMQSTMSVVFNDLAKARRHFDINGMAVNRILIAWYEEGSQAEE